MLNGDEIRKRREARGLSLREAAEEAGWGRMGFARWQRLEKGRQKNPELDTLLDVAKVLRCGLDVLVVPTGRPRKDSRPGGKPKRKGR